MLEKDELLWRVYADNRAYAKFHEHLRSVSTNLITVVAAGLLGLITFDLKLTFSDVPSAAFLSIVGLFGAIFSAKHYERARLHLFRSYEAFMELDRLNSDFDLMALKQAGDAKNSARFPILSKMRLNYLWNLFHLLISMIGISIIAIILFL